MDTTQGRACEDDFLSWLCSFAEGGHSSQREAGPPTWDSIFPMRRMGKDLCSELGLVVTGLPCQLSTFG